MSSLYVQFSNNGPSFRLPNWKVDRTVKSRRQLHPDVYRPVMRTDIRHGGIDDGSTDIENDSYYLSVILCRPRNQQSFKARTFPERRRCGTSLLTTFRPKLTICLRVMRKRFYELTSSLMSFSRIQACTTRVAGRIW